MSFILDALRKSETERQQKSAPGLADSHYRRSNTGRNIWIPLLVIVLAANAVILAFVMNRDTSEAEVAVANTEPARGPVLLANPEVRPLAREVPGKKATPGSVADSTGASGRTEPVVMQMDTNTLADPGGVESGGIQEGLPSLQQLVASGQMSVEPLHLDIHVYAEAQAGRFVFINMKKYREGEFLTEGPRIEEITRTGVILGYRGDRFTLDRD